MLVSAVTISRFDIFCDSFSWFNTSWVYIIWVSISWLNKLPWSEFVDQSQFSFGQSNRSVVFTLELKSDIIIERAVLLPARDTNCFFQPWVMNCVNSCCTKPVIVLIEVIFSNEINFKHRLSETEFFTILIMSDNFETITQY